MTVDRLPSVNNDGRRHRIKLIIEGRYFVPISHDKGGGRLRHRHTEGVEVLNIRYPEDQKEAKARLEGKFEEEVVEATDSD